MKQALKILYSAKATLVLLIIFSVSIGIATFIEESYDTATAKRMVYNAHWMEVLLVLLMLNFIGSIKRHKLLSKGRLAGLMFHSAFIVMILGAAITRYTGYEGMMHIREGGSSNVLFTSEPYLQVVNANGKVYEVSARSIDEGMKLKVINEKGETVRIKFKGYIKNAVEKVMNVKDGGEEILEVIIAAGKEQSLLLLKNAEQKTVADLKFSFNPTFKGDDLSFYKSENGISFQSTHKTYKIDSEKDDMVLIEENSMVDVLPGEKYVIDGYVIMLKKHHGSARLIYESSLSDNELLDVMVLEADKNDVVQEVVVMGGPGYALNHKDVVIAGDNYKIGYGDRKIELPFSLFLNDFILERYAGSKSPSSYASEVTLIDPRNGLKKPHRIFMNNVLDYDGYRFFQSSYDKDEKGTILSVNHDFTGTWVSYFGYFLLCLGLVLVLFSKESRFYALRQKIAKINKERKIEMLIVFFFILFTGSSFSQTAQQKVNAEHADKFGYLVSQTYGGRFVPVHSLAIDVMHKISRKDEFDVEGKGKMTCMEVFLDMVIDPTYWKEQKMIYIRDKDLRDALGIEGKYASFNQFFTGDFTYKLGEMASISFRKKPNEQNRYDKEVLKVDERVNICYMAFNGSLMRIFPDFSGENESWLSWEDNKANIPLGGSFEILNQDLNLDVLNFKNIMMLYFQELTKASETGDYQNADKMLGYLESIQRHNSLNHIIPDKTKVKYEVYYNKAQIFVKLKKWYSYLSLILLALAFTVNFRTRKNKMLNYALNFFIVVLGVAFLYHTFGMGLRWYLSGHAPWSNGYEALLLVSWGSIFAGFCFIRYTKIILAATTLMAFLSLMTAGHSSYDPQLTNLQPVLKSYWLIIHVASLTISYCFFALSFALGVINLFIMASKNKSNHKRLSLTLKELTYTNEMIITIGLVLATAGTFLGAVWANESWGRYWGWDAKETWALVILIAYTFILHLRLVPGLKSHLLFNASSVIGFGTVLMTFVGVNYYLSKGMHSYAGGETPAFPLWAWGVLVSIFVLIVIANKKEKELKSE